MTEPMEMSCAGLAEVAAELAFGVLTGRERAEAVAHLAGCDGCREDVRHLMDTSDGLLGLLPEREPPAGFETRVLDRLGLGSAGPVVPQSRGGPGRIAPRALSGVPSGRAGRSPSRLSRPSRPSRPSLPRRTLAAAAIAVAVIAAGAGGWGLGAGTAAHPAASSSSSLTTAAFRTASHQQAGEVFVYWGNPHWLYMSVDLPASDGMVTCQLLRADGTVTTVGSFQLAGGYGSWVSPDPGNLTSVRGARLVTANGTVLATATFG